MLRICSEFGCLWYNFVFLDVHDVFDHWFDNNFVEKKNVFGICEKFVCIHFNGNGQQFECEWMRIYFRFPLPLTRRQSWNKSDTTQCMLRVKQTTLSFRFPVWKRVGRLVQCKPLFLGFCV